MNRFALYVMALIGFQGCTDPDTSAPLLEIVNLIPSAQTEIVCGEPEDQAIALTSGQTFDFTFRLSDDQDLSQYKIDIHNNFDCHGHARLSETTDWYFVEIVDVSGSDQTINRQIQVPADVTAGNYHFSLQATDVAGNSAESAIYFLVVSNSGDTEAPLLLLTEPSVQSFSVQKGNSINFQGLLTDNNSLGDGSNGRIDVVFWQDGQAEVDLYEEEFESSIGESYNFNFDATVPITTADGTYIFEVRAYDAVNNPSNSIQFTVEVM